MVARGDTAAGGVRALGAVALTALTVAAMAAGAVRMAAGELALNQPEAALKWAAGEPTALTAVATARFDDSRRPNHDAEGARYARAALKAAPLDPAALRILALEAEKAGDAPRALTLMQAADAHSRRDILTELWLFAHADEARDWPAAARHADAALRLDWRLSPLVFPLLIASLNQPGGAAAVAARLVLHPDWRGPFLRAAADADPAATAGVLTALAAAGAPPTAAEGAALIGRMVGNGDYAGARVEWMRLLPRGASTAGSLIYNGDFKAAPGDPPFNWTLMAADGAMAEFSPEGLHVLGPASATAPLAEQLLALPPGAWRLTGMARIDAGPEGDLFSWRLTCAGREVALGRTDLSAGAPGWTPFSADFTVPPGCPAQWLRLAGLPHDGFDPAEAWFRAVKVTPQTAASSGG